MTMWLAIGLVGLGSYAIRVAPLLLGERLRVPDRGDAVLRHAAVGAMTALLVLGVQRVTTDPLSGDALAMAAALAIAGTVAVLGRPLPLVVGFGGLAYGLTLAAVSVVGA